MKLNKIMKLFNKIPFGITGFGFIILEIITWRNNLETLQYTSFALSLICATINTIKYDMIEEK